MSEARAWKVSITSEQLSGLVERETFAGMFSLMRVLNSLRTLQFAIATGQPHETPAVGTEAPSMVRLRYNCFFLMAAIIYEGLCHARYLGRSFAAMDSYARLGAAINSPEARRLEADLLHPIRNRLSFHFDRDELMEGISHLGSGPFTLMRGLGKTHAEFLYQLADDAAFSYLVHLEDYEDLQTRLESIIGTTTDFIVSFIEASDQFIAEVVASWGLEIEEE